MKCFKIGSLIIALIFLSSCTYQHWVVPNDVEIKQSETIYSLVTLDGDTVSFAGSHFIERERNRLTGVSNDEFIGNGGIYSDGIVSGVDSNGEEISFGEEDISAVKIPNRTAMVGTVSIIIVSIPAAILILGPLIEGGRGRIGF